MKKTTGFYILSNKNEIVYIGVSYNCEERIKFHRKNKIFDTYSIYKLEDERAYVIEKILIWILKPIYNKLVIITKK